MTLRTRLTIWYVIVLAGLLALTTTGLSYALNRIAQNRLDTALWMLAAAEGEIMSNIHQRQLERPHDQTISEIPYRDLLGVERGPIEKYITVVDDLGHVAYRSDNLAAPLPVNKALLDRALSGEVVYETAKLTSEIGELRVVYMPVRGTAVPHPFVALVGLPEAFVGGELRTLDLIVGLALTTLVLLTAASALFLAERAVKPLEEITTAAESINALNLNTRLPGPRTNDQIGRLALVINRMLARLDAAFEAQQSFTSRAAHEMRTPLTILKGETQVILRRQRTASEYEALLKSNLEEIDGLVGMIDGLLILARCEGGETKLTREPVRLDEVVRSVAESLQSIAREKEIELRIKTEALDITGDANLLERLTSNLIMNALVYTPRQGIVSARVERVNSSANLIVEDSGCGIAPDDLPHIFDRFYRSSRARAMHPNGSGIGLSVANAIVKLHDAKIVVSSEEHQGARFVVTFPLDSATAELSYLRKPF